MSLILISVTIIIFTFIFFKILDNYYKYMIVQFNYISRQMLVITGTVGSIRHIECIAFDKTNLFKQQSTFKQGHIVVIISE